MNKINDLLIKAIIILGIPATVVVGLDVGDTWQAPQWLLGIAYWIIGLILVSGITIAAFNFKR